MIRLRPVDALVLSICLWLTYRIVKTVRSRARTTKLNGPPQKSWLFGVTKEVFDGDNGAIYEAWEKAYGSIFQILGPLGERRIVLTDPKAIAHYYAKPDIYVKDDFIKAQTEDLVCTFLDASDKFLTPSLPLVCRLVEAFYGLTETFIRGML